MLAGGHCSACPQWPSGGTHAQMGSFFQKRDPSSGRWGVPGGEGVNGWVNCAHQLNREKSGENVSCFRIHRFVCYYFLLLQYRLGVFFCFSPLSRHLDHEIWSSTLFIMVPENLQLHFQPNPNTRRTLTIPENELERVGTQANTQHYRQYFSHAATARCKMSAATATGQNNWARALGCCKT